MSVFVDNAETSIEDGDEQVGMYLRDDGDLIKWFWLLGGCNSAEWVWWHGVESMRQRWASLCVVEWLRAAVASTDPLRNKEKQGLDSAGSGL